MPTAATIQIRNEFDIVAQADDTLQNGDFHRISRHQNVVQGVDIDFEEELELGDELLIVRPDGEWRTRVIQITDDDEIVVAPKIPCFLANGTNFIIRKKISRRVKEFELIFKPCMGLFSVDEWLPGNWKLELTPHSNLKYQRYAIESLLDSEPNIDFSLNVIDLQLYIFKGRSSSPMNGLKKYDFTEVRCQAQTITSKSLLNKAFVVNKNSHTFSIAYQKPDAGDDTRFSRTKFIMRASYEKRILRYQLRINGETIPTPLPDIETNEDDGIDFSTQQYYEQLQYNGTIFLDEPEGLKIWFERGPYYSYKLPKKLNADSNRLYVSSEFRDEKPENFLLLVFDHFYSGFQLEVENGMVVRCIKNSMKN